MVVGILDNAKAKKHGFKMLDAQLDTACKKMRAGADSLALLVANYRNMAAQRNLAHPDALRGEAPALYEQTAADQAKISRALLVVRMAHNLVDEFERGRGMSDEI